MDKYDFLATQPESRRPMYQSLFRNASWIERKYKRDLSDFDHDQAIEYLRLIKSTSFHTILNYKSLLVTYTSSINEHENVYTTITTDEIREITHDSGKHITKPELLDFVDNYLVNASDKALLLCLFEGIGAYGSEEISEIREKDLRDNSIVLVTGREILLYQKLIELIRSSCNRYELYAPNTVSFYCYLDPDDDRMFKKRINALAGPYIRRIRYRLAGISKNTGSAAIGYKKLLTSGFIWYVRQTMIENGLDSNEIWKSPLIEDLKLRYNLEDVKYFTLKERYGKYL